MELFVWLFIDKPETITNVIAVIENRTARICLTGAVIAPITFNMVARIEITYYDFFTVEK